MDKRGKVLLTVGLLLIASALCLLLHQLWEERQAGAAVIDALRQLSPAAGQTRPPGTAEEEPLAISGDCIGVLTIPSLGLEVPVFAVCSDELLQTAPCRYSGSAETGDLVIAGHNYDSHFGTLSALAQNAEVYFTDRTGNIFVYQAKKREILAASAVEEMTASPWALTLFTCTYSGSDRLTVRCEQTE